MRSARFALVLAAVLAAGGRTAAASGQATEKGAARPAPFWEALGDPVLNRLIEQARAGSPALRAASARRDGASASRVQAALDLVPAVSAGAGYTRQRFAGAALPGASPGAVPDQELWASRLELAWEVDVFGRLRGGLRARDALVDAADEDARFARIAVTAAVARSYLDLRGAQGQLEVARRNATNQRRTLELTRTRLEAGRGTELDTERAVAQLAFTEAAIPTFETRIANARLRIATLIGRAPRDLEQELGAAAALPELPDSLPAVDPDAAIGSRPDVASMRGRAAATRALVGSARADFLPHVSLAAGAGWAAPTVDALGNRGTFNYSIGPVVSWAAFDLGRVKARADEAEAAAVEAEAHYDEAVLRARQELDAGEVRYRSARTRLARLREAAAASERAAGLATMRYEGGIADFLQVLDAERTLLAAQDQLAQAETEATDAWVSLFEARGAEPGAPGEAP